MKNIICNPLFIIGLIIKVLAIYFVSPKPIFEWYGPFLDVSTQFLSFDPWGVWLSQGGTVIAFPYGYVMWMAFLPLTLICKIIGMPIFYGYHLTMMIVDFSLLLLLRRLNQNQDRLLLIIYWLSPIVFIASYIFGLNDLIPVFLLTLSLYFAQTNRMMRSGFVFVAAISAKFSMMLVLPFFFIYLLHNRSLRQFLIFFIKGILIGCSLFILPFLLSKGGLQMLFNNPEMGKVYSLFINLGGGISIYIIPLIYLLMLYAAWRIKRLNFDLFYTLLGIAFLLVVLMTPASPGWFLWIVPFLVRYSLKSDRMAFMLTVVFSIVYALSCFFIAPHYMACGVLWSDLKEISILKIMDLIVHTTMFAIGLIIANRIWREEINKNDYFKLSRKPFVIAIAGDSGSGKDTYSNALQGLFGDHSVTTLLGDDYHLWDRQKPMWQVMTHLNPMANDLERFASNLMALTIGNSIQARHYDHKIGKMTKPLKIKSNDFIIVNGLHALYLPSLRQCYNLSVYLDMDENLRRYFKIQRDVHKRGHALEHVLSAIQRREPDYLHFIKPQAHFADLVFSLQLLHPQMLEEIDERHPLRFKLVVHSKNSFNEQSLLRVLVGVCNLHVDVIQGHNTSNVELTIEGETSAEDIEFAAKIVCPKIFEFLDINPKWQGGMTGLMQLITLSHIHQSLKKRFT